MMNLTKWTLAQSKQQIHVQSQQNANNNLQRAVLTLSVYLELTLADWEQGILHYCFIKKQSITQGLHQRPVREDFCNWLLPGL